MTTARVVFGWGKQGHEIVGNLAWRLLSNSTRLQIEDLLDTDDTDDNNKKYCDEYCSPLAEVSDWADRARYSAPYAWSAKLHYIDVRDDLVVPGGCPAAPLNGTTARKCHFDYTRDCPNDVCVAGAIVNYTTRILRSGAAVHSTNLRSPAQRRSNYNKDDSNKLRRESLMFLTHFVGDIHQPLHCSRQSDRGGNSIHVEFLNDTTATLAGSAQPPRDYHPVRSDHETLLHEADRTTVDRRHPHDHLNLHAVWDDSIIETTLERDYSNSRNAMELSLLNMIWKISQTPAWAEEWLRCRDGSQVLCTTQWGEESLEYALAYAYRNVDGSEVVDGTKLTDGTYYETRLPIVRERLAVAGVRLASTLEIAFSGKQ
jgi:S1/P1 Nuclease